MGREPLLGQRDQLAVDARPEDVPGLDVQVGGPAIYGGLDELCHSVPSVEVDDVREGRPCKIAPDVVHDEGSFPFPEAVGHGADVRAHENARMTPEGVFRWQRLYAEYIERGAAELALVEQLQQHRLIEERSAGYVDDERVERQHLEHAAIDRTRGLGRMRCGDHEDVTPRRQARQLR